MPPATDPRRHRYLADGGTLDYRLNRTTRRRIVIRADLDGLQVNAPPGASLAQIEAALEHHREWIMARLALQQQQVRTVLAEGVGIPLLGERRILQVRHGNPSLSCTDTAVTLTLRSNQSLANTFWRYLDRWFLDWLQPRADRFAVALGRPSPILRLSRAQRRWGSCSAAGVVRLNRRLVHLAPELVDYVLAHEMAHLVEMNHSTAFWRVVESICPQWRLYRRQLRESAAALPDFE